MKKTLLVSTMIAMLFTISVGCGNKVDKSAGNGKGAGYKAGMVTDSGTIDDKSFNQGTWEGILRAEKQLGIKSKYLKPTGTTEADYSKEIGNLYDAGYKFIVTPGYKFETAIFHAQDKYKDAKFVLIDGTPHGDDNKPVIKNNTVAISFKEHESGFLAGVAAALQLKSGEAGFIGGMEIPPVQKYNWGFQQGVKYANDHLGTKLTMKPENVVYQGSFDNLAAGGQLAAQMYDRGVNAIFAAAGGVGIGAINEAKTRATSGKTVWIVGVDVDQFADGVYKDNKSVILTSAMKKVDQASFDMIQQELDGKFPGGQSLVFDVKNNGVGIPEKNPNLSDDTVKTVKDVFAKLQSGEIKVSGEQGSLIK